MQTKKRKALSASRATVGPGVHQENAAAVRIFSRPAAPPFEWRRDPEGRSGLSPPHPPPAPRRPFTAIRWGAFPRASSAGGAPAYVPSRCSIRHLSLGSRAVEDRHGREDRPRRRGGHPPQPDRLGLQPTEAESLPTAGAGLLGDRPPSHTPNRSWRGFHQ